MMTVPKRTTRADPSRSANAMAEASLRNVEIDPALIAVSPPSTKGTLVPNNAKAHKEKLQTDASCRNVLYDQGRTKMVVAFGVAIISSLIISNVGY